MSIRHASDGDNALIDELNKLVADVDEFLTQWNGMLAQLEGETGFDADYAATHGVTSAAVGLVRSSNRPNTLKTLTAPGATRGASSLAAATTRRVFGSSGDGSLQTELNAAQAAVQAVSDNFQPLATKIEADPAVEDYDATVPATPTSGQVQRGVSVASDPSEDGGRGGAGANARQPTSSEADGSIAARVADPDSGAFVQHVDADDTVLEKINQCRADMIALTGATGAPGTGIIGMCEQLDADAGVPDNTDYEASFTPATATQTEDLVRDGGHPNSSDVAL